MLPNGWTDDALCAEWFEHAFIPQATAQKTSDAPILLIYDGHGSHATPRVVELALKNNIHQLCLPPHTTHKLQPLDVGVFGRLQHAWEKQCGKYLDQHGFEMRRQDIVEQYMTARNTAFTPELIQSAFRLCGLNPLNPSIFSPADFAPSKNTSTHAHVPSTFPCHPQSLGLQETSAPKVASEQPVTSGAEDTVSGASECEDDAGSDSSSDDDNPNSDDEWECEVDEELLEGDLSTRFSRPPILVFCRDGSVVNGTSLSSNTPTPTSQSPSGHTTISDSQSDVPPPDSGLHQTSRKWHRISRSHSESDAALLDDLSIARSSHIPAHIRMAAYERAIKNQQNRLHELETALQTSEFHCEMAVMEVEEVQMKLVHSRENLAHL